MYRRNLRARIERVVLDTPVVLVNGARQTGKTTLVREIAGTSMRYVSLDDLAMVSAAASDPTGFIDGLGTRSSSMRCRRCRRSCRRSRWPWIDDARPGRYVLTGSADVLTLPTVSESLAGRIEPVTLWPLSQGELMGVEESFVDLFFSARPPAWPAVADDRDDVLVRALRGGFPPVVDRSESRRRDWLAAYITTVVQRDVRDLADIQHLASVPRLLSFLAQRSARC